MDYFVHSGVNAAMQRHTVMITVAQMLPYFQVGVNDAMAMSAEEHIGQTVAGWISDLNMSMSKQLQ